MKKIIAGSLIICFITTNSITPSVFAQTGGVQKVNRPSVFPQELSKIQIPAEIGKVEEVYDARRKGARGKGQGASENKQQPLDPGPMTHDPVVILIQDAHSIPEAQRSIQKIIEHFQSQYGVKLVGVEGAYSQMDPQIFKSFPDKKLLKQTLEDYFDKGEITGSTASAILSDKEGIYHGVEDWNLYEQGIALYLAAMGKEPEILTKLSEIEKGQEAEKQKIYSKELLEIDQAVRLFWENKSDLIQVIKTLAKVKRPEKGGQLEMLLAESESDGKDQRAVEQEVKKIAEEVKKALSVQRQAISEKKGEMDSTLNAYRLSLSAEFNQKYQEFKTSAATPEAFALYLKGVIVKYQLPINGSNLLKERVKTEKRMRDIEGTRFFRELEHYADLVKKSLFKNDEQRKLDEESRKLVLMKRLVHLELSREEWNEVKKLKGLKVEKLHSQNGINLSTFEHLNFLTHFMFYENAEKRDGAFFDRLTSLMKENNTNQALMVSGGFHTEGLVQRLREQKISYVLLMPKIGALPEDSHYREQMRGDVSWKDYFEVENGKINLYKAFVRGARDKLLQKAGEAALTSANQNNESQGRAVLKSWRDQIIRDLSEKGNIEKAGEYTLFMDEVSQKGREVELAKRLEKVNQFIEGLKDLETKGKLTEQNILKLLQPSGAAVQPVADGPAILSGDLLSADKIKIPGIEGEEFKVIELPGALTRPLRTGSATARAEVRTGETGEPVPEINRRNFLKAAGGTLAQGMSPLQLAGPAGDFATRKILSREELLKYIAEDILRIGIDAETYADNFPDMVNPEATGRLYQEKIEKALELSLGNPQMAKAKAAEIIRVVRTQYERRLRAVLDTGKPISAEDYVDAIEANEKEFSEKAILVLKHLRYGNPGSVARDLEKTGDLEKKVDDWVAKEKQVARKTVRQKGPEALQPQIIEAKQRLYKEIRSIQILLRGMEKNFDGISGTPDAFYNLGQQLGSLKMLGDALDAIRDRKQKEFVDQIVVKPAAERASFATILNRELQELKRREHTELSNQLNGVNEFLNAMVDLREQEIALARAEVRVSEPSVFQVRGQRSQQQDRFVNLEINIPNVKHGKGRLLAVMDGHGKAAGHFVAALVAWRLPDLFEATMKEKKGDVAEALKILFSDLHDETKDQTSGTTLSLVYTPDDESTAYAANLGDSPILIYDKARILYQSPLHNAANPKETTQARARGASFYQRPVVDNQGKTVGKVAYLEGRLGVLQVTRSFGDTDFAQFLDRTPDIASIPLTSPIGPVSVLLGSDGIYESAKDNAEKIVEFSRQNPDAQKMVERAGNNQAKDNVTVLLWQYNAPVRVRGVSNMAAITPATARTADRILNLLAAKTVSVIAKGEGSVEPQDLKVEYNPQEKMIRLISTGNQPVTLKEFKNVDLGSEPALIEQEFKKKVEDLLRLSSPTLPSRAEVRAGALVEGQAALQNRAFEQPNPLNVLRDPQIKAFLRGLLIHKYSQVKEVLGTNDIPGLVDQILLEAGQSNDPVEVGRRLNQKFHLDDPQGKFRKAQSALRKRDSSLESERIYKEQFYRGPVLLDIGTADGGFLDEQKNRNPNKFTRLIGSGLSREGSWLSRKAPFEFVLQEEQRFPSEKIGNGVVDSANLSNVLHHIYPDLPDPSSPEALAAVQGFLKNIYDTMAGGAALVVTEPSYPEVFNQAFAAAPEIAGSQETELNERFLQLSPEQRYQYLAWDDWYWAVVYGAIGKEGPAYRMAYRYFPIEKWLEIFKGIGFEIQEAQYWGFRSINLHGATEVFFVLKKPSRAETRAVLDKFLKANVQTVGIFGRAGSGKGTLLSYLVEELNKKLPDGKKFVIFPTGDYFRGITRLIRNKAQPGDEEKYRKFIRLVPEQEVKKMENGELISDETIIPVVQAVLEEDAYRDAYGIFFDGMPRSPAQLEAIHQGKLQWNGKPLQMDLNVIVDTPEEVLLQRILGRAEADRKRGQERPDAPWMADGRINVEATRAILSERLKSYNDVTQPLVTALQKETNAIAVQGFARGEGNEPLSEQQEVAAVREQFFGKLDTWLDGRSEVRAKKIELVGGEVGLVSLVGFVAAHSAKVAAEIPQEVAFANKWDVERNVIVTNFKPWTVYEADLTGKANAELIARAQSEQKRFAGHREAWIAMSEEERRKTLAEGWKDLDNEEWQGPPRILLVPENEMAKLEPEMTETEEGFQFGSNGFAIYGDKNKIAYEGNQTDLAEGISGDQFVRMSAASLARIVVEIPDAKTGEKKRHYLLQGVLAGKGQVRYQPFGGRAYFSQKGIDEILKREGKFFNRFGIITETKNDPEMAFYIKKSNMDDFLAFYNQERVSGNWDYFVDAAEVLRIELMKELAGVNQDGTPAKNGLPIVAATYFEKKQEAEQREADEVRKISLSWRKKFEENHIPMNGTIVEVAPGERTKVGDALPKGFYGRIIVIEPDEAAAVKVRNAYQQKFPEATVEFVAKPLEEVELGPDVKVDALVANHPFDDMILADAINRGKAKAEGWTLTAVGLNDIKDKDIPFDENYAQSMLNVVGVWQEVIKKMNPNYFIANQYLSRTLSNQGSHIRQNSGLIVLDLLRDVFRDQLVEQPGKGSVGSFDDPLWWIVAQRSSGNLTRDLSERPAAMKRLGEAIFVPQMARQLNPAEFDVAFTDGDYFKKYEGDPSELAKSFAIVLDSAGKIETYADLQEDPTGIALGGGNLGSGRAVYHGSRWNILGVGPTTLVRTKDPIHSTGTESLPASLRRAIIAKWVNAFTRRAGPHPVVIALKKTAQFFWSQTPVPLALIVREDDGALDRPSHVEHTPAIKVDFEKTLTEYAKLDAEYFAHRMMIGAWSTGNYSLDGHIIDLETVSFVKLRGPYTTMSAKYKATRFGYEGFGFLSVLNQLAKVKGVTGMDIEKRFYEERQRQLSRSFLSLLGVDPSREDRVLTQQGPQVTALAGQFETLAKKVSPKRANLSLFDPAVDDQNPTLLDMSNLFRHLAELYESGAVREQQALDLLIRKTALEQVKPGVIYQSDKPDQPLNEAETFIKDHAVVSYDQLQGFLDQTKIFIRDLFQLLEALHSQNVLPQKSDWQAKLQFMNQDLPIMAELTKTLADLAEQYRLGKIDGKTLRVETDKLSQLPYYQTGESQRRGALPSVSELMVRLRSEAPANLAPGRSEVRTGMNLEGGEVKKVSEVSYVASKAARVDAETPEAVKGNAKDEKGNLIVTNIKPWTVYEVALTGEAAKQFTDFARFEQERYQRSREAWQKMSVDERKALAANNQWKDLTNPNWQGPPRVLLVSEEEMKKQEPKQYTNGEGFVFGDNSFAIVGDESRTAYEKGKTDLFDKTGNEQFIRVSAASLVRITVDVNGKKYVLQGKENQLAKKGVAQYQPFGGHAYFTQKFLDERRGNFGIVPEKAGEELEMAFYMPKAGWNEFFALYNGERQSGNWQYFLDPAEVLRMELMEEIAGQNLDGTPAEDGLRIVSPQFFIPRARAEVRVEGEIFTPRNLYPELAVSTRTGKQELTARLFGIFDVAFPEEGMALLNQRVAPRGDPNEGEKSLHWVTEDEIRKWDQKDEQGKPFRLKLRVPVSYDPDTKTFTYGIKDVAIINNAFPLIEGAQAPKSADQIVAEVQGLEANTIRISSAALGSVKRVNAQGEKEYLLGLNIKKVAESLKQKAKLLKEGKTEDAAKVKIEYQLKALGGGIAIKQLGLAKLKELGVDPNAFEAPTARYEGISTAVEKAIQKMTKEKNRELTPEEKAEATAKGIAAGEWDLRIQDFPKDKLAQFYAWISQQFATGELIETSPQREFEEELGTIQRVDEKGNVKLEAGEYGVFSLEESQRLFRGGIPFDFYEETIGYRYPGYAQVLSDDFAKLPKEEQSRIKKAELQKIKDDYAQNPRLILSWQIYKEFRQAFVAANQGDEDLGKLLDEAAVIASRYHAQADNSVRDDGRAYIAHPLEIAYQVVRESKSDKRAVIAALFHDLIEDTAAQEETEPIYQELTSKVPAGLFTQADYEDALKIVGKLTENTSYREAADLLAKVNKAATPEEKIKLLAKRGVTNANEIDTAVVQLSQEQIYQSPISGTPYIGRLATKIEHVDRVSTPTNNLFVDEIASVIKTIDRGNNIKTNISNENAKQRRMDLEEIERWRGFLAQAPVSEKLKNEMTALLDWELAQPRARAEVRGMAPEVMEFMNNILINEVESSAEKAHNEGWMRGKQASLEDSNNPFVGLGAKRVRVRDIDPKASREELSRQLGVEISDVKYAAIQKAIAEGKTGQDITHNWFKPYKEVLADQPDGGADLSARNALPLLVIGLYLTDFRGSEIQSKEDLLRLLNGLISGQDKTGIDQIARLNHTAFESLVLGQGERSFTNSVLERAGSAVIKAARTDFKGFDSLTKDVQGLDEYTLLPAAQWFLQRINQATETDPFQIVDKVVSTEVESAAEKAHNEGWMKGKQASLEDPNNPFVGLGAKRVRVRDIDSKLSREQLSRQLGVEISDVKYAAIQKAIAEGKTGQDITHNWFKPYAEVLADQPDGGVDLGSRNALPLLVLGLYLTDFRGKEIQSNDDLRKLLEELLNGTDKKGIDQIARLNHTAFQSLVLGQGERGYANTVLERAGQAVVKAARTDFKGFDRLTKDVQGLDEYTLLPAAQWMMERIVRAEVRAAISDQDKKQLQEWLSSPQLMPADLQQLKRLGSITEKKQWSDAAAGKLLGTGTLSKKGNFSSPEARGIAGKLINFIQYNKREDRAFKEQKALINEALNILNLPQEEKIPESPQPSPVVEKEKPRFNASDDWIVSDIAFRPEGALGRNLSKQDVLNILEVLQHQRIFSNYNKYLLTSKRFDLSAAQFLENPLMGILSDWLEDMNPGGLFQIDMVDAKKSWSKTVVNVQIPLISIQSDAATSNQDILDRLQARVQQADNNRASPWIQIEGNALQLEEANRAVRDAEDFRVAMQRVLPGLTARAEVRAVSEEDTKQIQNLLDQLKEISSVDLDKLQKGIRGIFNPDFSFNDPAHRKLFGEVTPKKLKQKAASELQNDEASKLGRRIVGLIENFPNSVRERPVQDKSELIKFVQNYGLTPVREVRGAAWKIDQDSLSNLRKRLEQGVVMPPGIGDLITLITISWDVMHERGQLPEDELFWVTAVLSLMRIGQRYERTHEDQRWQNIISDLQNWEKWEGVQQENLWDQFKAITKGLGKIEREVTAITGAQESQGYEMIPSEAGSDIARGHWVNDELFLSDGNRIVILGDDGITRVWDLQTKTELFPLQANVGQREAYFSSDGNRIVTTGDDGIARVWNANTGREIFSLQIPAGQIIHAAFSPDRTRIVTTSFDNTLRVWDAKTGGQMFSQQLTAWAYKVSFSSDGSRILTSSGAGAGIIQVWDAENGAELFHLEEPGVIRSALFSPDGNRIATRSLDATFRIWDAKTGAELFQLPGHTGEINHPSFSSDGSKIITSDGAGGAGAVRVWNTNTGKELLTLPIHLDEVSSAHFSPDGKKIVTTSGQTIWVWDAETGQALARFETPVDEESKALFSSDGSKIITGRINIPAGQGIVRVWDLSKLRIIFPESATARSEVRAEKEIGAKLLGNIAVIWRIAGQLSLPDTIEDLMNDLSDPEKGGIPQLEQAFWDILEQAGVNAANKAKISEARTAEKTILDALKDESNLENILLDYLSGRKKEPPFPEILGTLTKVRSSVYQLENYFIESRVPHFAEHPYFRNIRTLYLVLQEMMATISPAGEIKTIADQILTLEAQLSQQYREMSRWMYPIPGSTTSGFAMEAADYQADEIRRLEKEITTLREKIGLLEQQRIQLQPSRAEVRTEVNGRYHDVARGVARIILSSENLSQDALTTLIKTVRQTVTEISAARFGEIVREEAQKILDQVERERPVTGGTRVTKEMAEKAVVWFTNFLVTNKIKGNLAIGFDIPGDGKNLIEALQNSTVKSGIGLALFGKGTANGQLRENLKGLNIQFVSNFKSFRPSKAVENDGAVPIVGEEVGADYLIQNQALFGVGVNKEGAKEGEPFLEVVEKVLQITSGLLLADRIKKVEDLKNPEIHAALLKGLFDNQEQYQDVIAFNENGITVNRSRLMSFVTEYLAKKTIEAAA